MQFLFIYFSSKNILKLQTLKNLLHTNGKSHYSLEMARKLIGDTRSKKNADLQSSNFLNNNNIKKLTEISMNLKELLK